MIGQTILQYKITAKQGEGGIGEVCLATDTKLDCSVALKFLPPALQADPEAKQRLLREARAASKLNHKNILTIYDVAHADGRDFIVMEYVEGKSLKEIIDSSQTLPLDQALRIGLQICDGLASATGGARGAGDDLWVLPVSSSGAQTNREPSSFQQTEFDEDDSRFSPDGRLLAYGCDESGRFEVYVRPYPGAGGKRQISIDGGDFPVWRRDGKGLFHLSADRYAMAVDINGEGQSLQIGAVHRLFQIRSQRATSPWDVSGDGQRFIILVPEEGRAASSINILTNWHIRAGRQRSLGD